MHRTTLVVVLALMAAACGDGTDAGDGTTSTVATTVDTTLSETTTTIPASTTTSTTVVETTTTSAAPTTTTSGPVYAVDRATLYPPDPLPGSDSASGSGCAPGSGVLPDGVWFGIARALSAPAVTFDLACFYFGDPAVVAAAADGVTDVPNDYYIRNQSPATRPVPVSPGATVWTIGADSTDGLEEVAYPDWPLAGFTYTPCPGEYCTVWLYVNAGAVTEIMEQYLP